MRTTLCLLAATASAIKGPWLSNLNLMLTQVECSNEICEEPIPEQPDSIAWKLMDNSANFSDKCTPSSDCWPSEDEWDELDILLGGKLLQDVEPYLAPCHDLLRLD